MADKLLALLTRLSTGALIVTLLVLIIGINRFVLPAIYPPDTLDVQFSYSPERAYQLIDSYGKEGRQYYVLIELTLDAVYPLILALFFSSLTIYTFRRTFPLNSFWQKLPLLGPLTMVVDYLENTSIVAMLLNYPQRLDVLAQAANLFTIAKFVLSGFELVLMLIGLVGWLGKAIYGRVKKNTGMVDSEN